MLALDIQETSFQREEEEGGSGGLYRCRTFPGLRDLMDLQEQGDSDEEEG